MRNKEKGITLIALIITIIVMLILVGVVVTVVIQSNLLGTAKTAGDKYKTAYEDESNMSQIEINGKKYDSIEDYLAGVESIPESHNWVRTGDNIKCEHCNTSLTIGQELNYTKTGAGVSTINGDKSGVSNGITAGDLNTEDFDAKGAQTIHSDSETKWVVLGVEDSNNNGTNETLLLTTANPTEDRIVLYGAGAYNNCIEEIKRMCKEIYGADARGMTIKDVNECLNYKNPKGIYFFNDQWNEKQNLTTKLKDLGEKWTAITDYNTNNTDGVFYDPSNPEGIKDNGAKVGEYNLDGYFYHLSDDGIYLVDEANASDTSHIITTATRTVIFGESDNLHAYWLASRGVCADPDYVSFGPGAVVDGCAYSYGGLFCSIGYSSFDGLPLRCVVSLRADIPAVVE